MIQSSHARNIVFAARELDAVSEEFDELIKRGDAGQPMSDDECAIVEKYLTAYQAFVVALNTRGQVML